VKQQINKPLKDYIARFCNITCRIPLPNIDMFVDSFVERLQLNPFSESLIQWKK